MFVFFGTGLGVGIGGLRQPTEVVTIHIDENDTTELLLLDTDAETVFLEDVSDELLITDDDNDQGLISPEDEIITVDGC
jgi:hypothetical protein